MFTATTLDTDSITNAYEELTEASVDLAKANVRLIVAKQELQGDYDRAAVEGAIEGKNAEVRQATAHALLSVWYDKVDKATIEYETAKGYYNMKRIAVDMIESLIAWLKG